MKTRGFTLVEMVMVIVILGIISAVVGLFLRPAMTSYFGTQRRAGMTDEADTALRRMGRDVRSAVPNSIRTPNNQCFELAPTSTGGRYRLAPDTVNGSSMALDTTTTTPAFDVLSPMSTTPSAGDIVVVDNQNTDDVYNLVNTATISGVTFPPTTFPVTAGISRITLTASKQFPTGYEGGRFVVVPNNGGNPAVFYICSSAGGALDSQGNATGVLYRYVHPFVGAYPGACPVVTGATPGVSVVASNVQSCNFEYNASEGATQQSGFIWMQLILTQVNESVSLSYGVHVDNVP
ncbi:MAG TPA: type II secretion system protein [Burkholderiaceae bacterium]|nr:type II secretion system protein [Burkholderiaceae bacterium]